MAHLTFIFLDQLATVEQVLDRQSYAYLIPHPLRQLVQQLTRQRHLPCTQPLQPRFDPYSHLQLCLDIADQNQRIYPTRNHRDKPSGRYSPDNLVLRSPLVDLRFAY